MDEPWKPYTKWSKPGTGESSTTQLHLHRVPGIGKFIETESRIKNTSGRGQGSGAGGREDDKLLLNGYRAPVCIDEKVLEIVMLRECIALNFTLTYGWRGNFCYVYITVIFRGCGRITAVSSVDINDARDPK